MKNGGLSPEFEQFLQGYNYKPAGQGLAELTRGGRNVLGTDALNQLFAQRGITDWQGDGGTNEAGASLGDGSPTAEALKAFDGYKFDWQDTGGANTGTLTAYDPAGAEYGRYGQKDTTGTQSFMDWAKLAAVGFGGAGLAGLGPMAGLLGGGGGGALGGAGGGGGGAGALGLEGASYALPGAEAGFGLSNVGALGAEAAPSWLSGMGAENLAAIEAFPALTQSGMNAAALGPSGSLPGLAAGGIPWGQVGKYLGGQALSVGSQMYGANKAAGAMSDATNKANDLARYAYDTTRADNAPALAARNSALSQMQALLSDPSTITKQPGYQFGMDQGTKTLNNGAAARGMTYSGAQGKALQRYGQDYAGTKLDASFNRLSSLAGAGQPGAGTIAAATGNYGNTVGANINQQGEVNAEKYLVGGNALGTAVNGLTAYGERKGWWKP